MSKTFSKAELKEFNGKGGKAAYIAFNGKVYDVTKGSSWDNGGHFGQHEAGMDLTEELKAAPHGDENLANMPVVGVLIG